MSWVYTGITVATTVAASAYGAYSSYQSGKAQQAAMDYNALVAEQNAKHQAQMAEFNAKLAENESIAEQQFMAAETERMRSEKQKALARKKALYGKTGAVISEGTPLLVLAEQAGEMELDIITRQADSYRRQQALGHEADQYRWQAGVALMEGQAQAEGYRHAGSQAYKAGKMAAIGSILTGSAQAAGQVAGKRYGSSQRAGVRQGQQRNYKAPTNQWWNDRSVRGRTR